MDDLISRKAAIELVKDVCDVIMRGCNSHYDPGVGDEVYDDVLEVDAILKCNKEIRKSLKDLPSAQPERKKGKWLHDKDDTLLSGYCSCCGWESIIMETDVADMPYCPNCGSYNGGGESG